MSAHLCRKRAATGRRRAAYRIQLSRTLLALGAAISGAACEGDGGTPAGPVSPPPPAQTGTVTGIVRSIENGTPVSGANVAIGNIQTITAPDGLYQLTNVPSGATTLTCEQEGFNAYQAAIFVPAGTATHNISLDLQDFWELPGIGGISSALYVPRSVQTVRGVIAAFGGPDTRAYANPNRSFGAPDGVAESELRFMRASFRELAASKGLAILGFPTAGALGSAGPLPTTDGAVWQVLSLGAELTGRPSMAVAPLVVYVTSGGGYAGVPLAVRNPGRTLGFFFGAVVDVTANFGPDARGVPGLLLRGELDLLEQARRIYDEFRPQGHLLAYTQIPRAGHIALMQQNRDLVSAWIGAIVDLRAPDSPGGPLKAIDETAGWLGDPVTGSIHPWADYPATKLTGSWLPSEAVAELYRIVVTP